MARLSINPRARLDTSEIFDFLSTRSPTAAIRFLDAVEMAYRRIKEDRKLGMKLYRPNREDEDWRFRRIPEFKNYLIYYRVTDGETKIVRVLHGSRDVEKALTSALA